MGIPVESPRGRAALMIAHCAGMVDLVALSVWVRVLITDYGFDASRRAACRRCSSQASSSQASCSRPAFTVFPARRVASAGFAISALTFWLAASATGYAELAVLHALSGAAAGSMPAPRTASVRSARCVTSSPTR